MTTYGVLFPKSHFYSSHVFHFIDFVECNLFLVVKMGRPSNVLGD